MAVRNPRIDNLAELKTTHKPLPVPSVFGCPVVFVIQPWIGLPSTTIGDRLDSGSRRHAALQDFTASQWSFWSNVPGTRRLLGFSGDWFGLGF